MKFVKKVKEEIKKARNGHKNMTSAHEAYAVILEELDEFKIEVFKKEKSRNKQNMLDELVQLGAMAQRAAEDLKLI